MSGIRRSNPTALWVMDSDRATACSAVITPSLRAATALRVWQRQSMEWIAAVLAAEPTAMPRSTSRRLHTGPANSSSCESSRSLLAAWRDPAHGVGAQILVPQVLGHAVIAATWRTHQA